TFAGTSMLLSCLLVMAIFVDAMVEADFARTSVVIFVASVVCLITSLVAFLRDVWMSLRTLHLEVERARQR
ncbi:MAG: DUF2721 domain-containing protein, partial [Gemmatimonadetes bacterium]|nr:DUF2721 domain-containing protein [Gemmatimonadota bacterium]